jgi:hypothetical protein
VVKLPASGVVWLEELGSATKSVMRGVKVMVLKKFAKDC